MTKKLPNLENDQDAENLLEQDLSEYLDLGTFQKVSFEFLPKTEKVNLRFSRNLLDTVKEQAEREGIPYQKYIRRAVEQSLVNHNDR